MPAEGAEDGNKYRLKAPLVVAKRPVPVASSAATVSGAGSMVQSISTPTPKAFHVSVSSISTPPLPPAPSHMATQP